MEHEQQNQRSETIYDDFMRKANVSLEITTRDSRLMKDPA